MKVLELNPALSTQPDFGLQVKKPLDLTLCTRCNEPWGFELVEQIEMWSCDHCGYEAREKSVDFFRMQLKEQESITT